VFRDRYFVLFIIFTAITDIFTIVIIIFIIVVVIVDIFIYCYCTAGMADIGAFSNSAASVGLRWSERANSAAAFPLTVTYNWLILDFFYYLFLALYLR
jgi:hypothetical protein